jgi:hypothetical protein
MTKSVILSITTKICNQKRNKATKFNKRKETITRELSKNRRDSIVI